MSNLFGNIGKFDYDYLLADPNGADKIAIPCKPGNGVIARGTVMFREANGMYSPAAASDAVATNSLVVLDEAVDTSADASIAEDAAAYRAGRMIDGRVKLKDGAELTDSVKLVLRQQGIVFNHMVGGEPYNNVI